MHTSNKIQGLAIRGSALHKEATCIYMAVFKATTLIVQGLRLHKKAICILLVILSARLKRQDPAVTQEMHHHGWKSSVLKE